MIVLALTQCWAWHNYIDRAGGWKKRSGARRAGFNQSFVMSIVIAFALGIVGFFCAGLL